MIPIFSPYINSKAKKNVNFAIKSNWISSQGKYVSELEEKIKKYHKMKFCLVTSSCTSALHLSLLSFGLKKGDVLVFVLTRLPVSGNGDSGIAGTLGTDAVFTVSDTVPSNLSIGDIFFGVVEEVFKKFTLLFFLAV